MSFARFINNVFEHGIRLRLSDQKLNNKLRVNQIDQKTDDKKFTKFDWLILKTVYIGF